MDSAHEVEHAVGNFGRAAVLFGQIGGHQPGGLSFHDGQAGG